ncbi:hypothetical protein [Vibrio echinoideorum]|uniref:hypothetical protein n=1 Tax=Vibrio echinoideorum TaxID=2100116 RepID=UPI00354AEC38
MRPPLHAFAEPKAKQRALRDRDVYDVVAHVHAITARPELSPLILAVAEQCLIESIRPEQALMSLIQASNASLHNPRFVFPKKEDNS